MMPTGISFRALRSNATSMPCGIMFGVIIECDTQDEYRYHIDNPEILEDDSMERRMLNYLSVGSTLTDSQSVHDCILLENMPTGNEHLLTIIKTIKSENKVEVDYV